MSPSSRNGIYLRTAGLAPLLAMIALLATVAWATAARGETIVMKDGRRLEGLLGAVSGIGESSNSAGGENAPVKDIALIDDNLRRTFVPHSRIQRSDPDKQHFGAQKIQIKQQVAGTGTPHVAQLGPILKMEPFDDFGRRIVTLASGKGTINVIQGITEITPTYTRVQGLAGAKAYQWDMRIATNSIPRETLYRILSNVKVIDPKNADDRKKLVQLLFDSERYADAQAELEAVIRDFPAEKDLQKEVSAIRQFQARQFIDEINLRRASGQNDLAFSLLESFPREQVAGETLQQVAQMLEKYASLQKQAKDLLEGIEKNLADVKDENFRERAKVAVKEIKNDLNYNTLDRLADYIRLADDEQLSPDQKLSLAISGWLLGNNHGSTNLAVTLSLLEIRDLVRKYLSPADRGERHALLGTLRHKEGNSCEMVARLVAQMKPPVETPATAAEKSGFYEREVSLHDPTEPPIGYVLQLPPEYDPYRRYPMIVTLHGGGTTPIQQLDWWAGSPNEQGIRFGQSMRYGYIVMAVDWARPEQTEYEYSDREHAAVLASVLDACHRFSVDTDRIFLSGHSMGGNAAWDIAVSHPDLWAGVIPIVAIAQKYCMFYRDNAALVPFYVVQGELDGAYSKEQVKSSAAVLDHYLKYHYDVTIVQYQGRGHEHFYEEIPRLFDWMQRRHRDFFPKKMTLATMRPGDKYFWWLGLAGLPPASVVEPIDWPPKRGFKAISVVASIKPTTIYIQTGAERVTVWLSPEMVDFNKPVKIDFKGKQLNRETMLTPDLPTLLDDVRVRGDRQHPFWVKIE